MVSVPDSHIRMLGLVTREDFAALPDGMDDGQTVAVYLPMSYQMGGYTIFADKANIRAVNMSIEEAMRFIVTAGVSTQKHDPAEKAES